MLCQSVQSGQTYNCFQACPSHRSLILNLFELRPTKYGKWRLCSLSHTGEAQFRCFFCHKHMLLEPADNYHAWQLSNAHKRFILLGKKNTKNWPLPKIILGDPHRGPNPQVENHCHGWNIEINVWKRTPPTLKSNSEWITASESMNK